MWNLFRKLPEGVSKSSTLIEEDASIEFDYFISESKDEVNAERVDSIIEWDKCWSDTPEKYGVARLEIQDRCREAGWSALSDEEKSIAIKYRAYPNSDIGAAQVIVYLMSKGYTQEQAVGRLIKEGAIEQERLIESCRYRGTNKILFMIVGKYLSIPDQSDLNELVSELLNNFIFRGQRGTKDGQDGNEGLLDFIEGTVGTSYEITNLMSQDYQMTNGDPDATNLKNELANWFRYGKHEFKDLI